MKIIDKNKVRITIMVILSLFVFINIILSIKAKTASTYPVNIEESMNKRLVKINDFYSSILNNSRTVRVYLPLSY